MTAHLQADGLRLPLNAVRGAIPVSLMAILRAIAEFGLKAIDIDRKSSADQSSSLEDA